MILSPLILLSVAQSSRTTPVLANIDGQSSLTSSNAANKIVQSSKVVPDLAEYSAQAARIRTEVYAAAKAEEAKTGKTVPRATREDAIQKEVAALLQSVDPAQLNSKDAADWAGLFASAKLVDQALSLQRRAVEYLNVQLMYTMSSMIPRLIEQGNDEEAQALIRHVPDMHPSMIGQIGESVSYGLSKAGYDKTKLPYALKCLDSLRARVDLTPQLPGEKQSIADYVYVDLSMKMLEMRYANEPSPEIIDEIKNLRGRFVDSKSKNTFGQSPTYRVDRFFDTVMSVGSEAPALVVDQSLGEYKGWESLKGHVVLLDFMAHWCGPCKAALPGIKKMQEEFGPSGFQVVSVSSFYGYYGATKNLAPSEEFKLMETFVKIYGMSWPVVFDGKQVSHSKYHVGGIPHLVLIDRKGKIRKVQVGSTPEGEAELRSLAQVLLAER